MAFPLFDDNRTEHDETWTAREEVQLLDEMEDKGYGNW